MPKPIAVILLNWNTPSLTLRCIETLLGNNNNELFDIILADNGSTDNSVEQFRASYPDLTIIENAENLGFAEGNNRAIGKSIALGYKYSLLLNSDTEVWEDIVTPLFNYMENNLDVGGVQPAIYYLDDTNSLWNGGSYFNSVLGITYSENNSLAPEIKDVDWLTGCCMFLRNDVLKETGLFNKAFFLYYEDVELSFRIRKSGSLLKFYPFSKIFHAVGSSGKIERKENEGMISPIIHYYNVRNRIWNLRINGKVVYYPVYLVYNMGFYGSMLGYFLMKRRFKKAKMLLRGINDGLFKLSSTN